MLGVSRVSGHAAFLVFFATSTGAWVIAPDFDLVSNWLAFLQLAIKVTPFTIFAAELATFMYLAAFAVQDKVCDEFDFTGVIARLACLGGKDLKTTPDEAVFIWANVFRSCRAVPAF